MQPTILIPLRVSVSPATLWAAVAAIAAVAGMGIAMWAAHLTKRGLHNAREQDLASRVDALLATLGTGEIAEARDDIYTLAVSEPENPHLGHLDPIARHQVFKLLWALQRVSVLAPVIKGSGEASVQVLKDQVTRIVDALTTLGNRLDDCDKINIEESRKTTVLALESFQEELPHTQPADTQSWSTQLKHELTPSGARQCCPCVKHRIRAGGCRRRRG